MEGQTHTRTCSLAVCTHLCAHAFICTLNMHIFKYSWTHTHTNKLPASTHQGVLCLPVFPPAVDTLGASRQHRPCSLIPQSSLLTINRKKKLPELLSPPFLPISTDFIRFSYYCYLSLSTFSVSVCILNTTVKPLVSLCSFIILKS